MRILIADDNRELRAALRLLLQELGVHAITEAEDLAEAIATLRHARADVVLLDWELPPGGFPGDGAAFVASVKTAAPARRVIAMSGRPEAENESLTAGCDAFVSRNEPPDRLVRLLGGDALS